ncbi:PA2779 family protein [Desulfurivibrio sp. D14AmB]|uniref:PA2779 family protein n=1 Tax=Desulfurivibrio sp. D14AmB TaxID=3374370 RepID=UPI00376EFDCC
MRKLIRYFGKPLCLLLLTAFVLLDLNVYSAKAGLIGTEAILTVQANDEARARVALFLERDEVRQALARHGISPAEAGSRVAALTDAEVLRLAEEIDHLPAGAGVGTIVGAAVFVFIVLLVTDILGFTKVFPFTRSVR